jgi:hypothetical protein
MLWELNFFDDYRLDYKGLGDPFYYFITLFCFSNFCIIDSKFWTFVEISLSLLVIIVSSILFVSIVSLIRLSLPPSVGILKTLDF